MTRRAVACRRASRLLAVVLPLALAVALPVRAQAPAAPPGSELDVYVMTMGQGELVWERFGHNALGIRDRARGTDLVYNWGTFSFAQPGFLPRFLRGEMRYWMAPADAFLTRVAYQQANRSVAIQWLDLAPAQKDSLRRLVEWTAQEEHKYYRYDYYRDNCSTRVRDALDLVLGGAIRRATDTAMTAMTYRDHSLRLMDGMPWTRAGIDLGLGRPTDAPISAWQAMFIPMEFQRRLRAVRIVRGDGSVAPLVTSEEVLVAAQRPAERMDVPALVTGTGLLGLALAAAMLLAGYRLPGRGPSLALAMAWSAVAGLFGLLLALLWTVTQHVAAHANQNLFFAQPLWLAVLVLLPFVRRRRGARDAVLRAVRASAALTLLGAIVALTPWGQASGAIAAFATPVNLAAYLLVLRVVHLAQQDANRTRGLA